MRLLRWFIIGAVLALLLLSSIVALCIYEYQRSGPLTEAKTLVIAPGSSFRSIAKQLAEEGIIRDPLSYQAIVYVRKEAARFKAGEYLFVPAISPEQITNMLVQGKSITHSITVPEGKISADIVALLTAEPVLTGDVPLPLPEGSVLPETYFFLRGETRAQVLARMKEAHVSLLREQWPARAPNLPFSTPLEAITLASIVEKETGATDERARVAAVFINRLRLGMPLQSDPTTLYGMYQQSGVMSQQLSRANLAQANPYNTYQIQGLPPGPICHPGRAALQAVLHPAETRELYFVANGKGGHRFAETLAQHNRHVARYRQTMREEAAGTAPTEVKRVDTPSPDVNLPQGKSSEGREKEN